MVEVEVNTKILKIDFLKFYFDFLNEVKKLRDLPGKGFNFRGRDISVGDIGEDLIKRLLVSDGWNVLGVNQIYDEKEKLITFDILAHKDGKEETFEVKLDLKCAPGHSWVEEEIINKVTGEKYKVKLKKPNDTGNIYGEIMNNNNKSGIYATKATYFVTIFIFLGEIWTAKSKILRNLISHSNYIPLVKGGENLRTTGALIDREYHRKLFRVTKFELNLVEDYQ